MAAGKGPSKKGQVTIARHGVLRSRHPLVSLLAMFGVVLGVVGVSTVGLTAYNL